MNNLALIARVLGVEPQTVQQTQLYQDVEVKLDDRWYSFEEELGKYKKEYIDTHSKLLHKLTTLTNATNDIKRLKNAASTVSHELAEPILKIIQDFTSKNDIDVLKQETSELAAKSKAMENILVNTQAKKFAQYTCFICMDEPSTVCVDPCGHMMCQRCWTRVNSENCPACRTPIEKGIRMYSLV